MANLPDNPSIGYIALLLLLLGLFLILSGFGIVKTDKVTVAHGFKTWFFGLLIMSVGGFLGVHELKLIDINKYFPTSNTESVPPTPKSMIQIEEPTEKNIPASPVANITESKESEKQASETERSLYGHEEISNETYEDFKKTSSAKDLNSTNTDKKTTALLVELCTHANSRAVIVYYALWHLQEVRKTGQRCMTQGEYLKYSTREFDKKFPIFIGKIREHIGRAGIFESKPDSKPSRWLQAIFSEEEPSAAEIRHLNDFCMIQMTLGEELFMPLRVFRKNVDSNKFSTNPHAPLEYRWGAAKDKYIPECPMYN